MKRRVRHLLLWGVLAMVLACLPLTFDSVLGIAILNQMGIAIVFALSYNMLLGQGGMLSFGHAVYFGLGGFLAVHAMNFIAEASLPVPLPLVPALGGISGLLVAIFVGTFSTRRAGTVFAMISLGIGEMVAASSIIFVGFFGGEEGVTGDRTLAPPLAGIDFARDIEVYYLVAFWLFLATLAMYGFTRTPLGRMANAVRDNAERVEFVGYNQHMVRFGSFCAAGLFAGIAGGLFAVNYEILTEENLNLVTSGNVLLMAYIGGTGLFVGPIVGAVIFTLLESVLSNYTEIWQLYVGIVFVLTVLFMPSGLTGLAMLHRPLWRRHRLRALAGPYLLAVGPGAAIGVGIIALLEMLHHANSALIDDPSLGLLGLTVDTSSPGPWIGAALLAVLGALGTRPCATRIRAVWDRETSVRDV